jgi:HK97 family phage major capsid protein
MAARINELRQKRADASAALQALIETHLKAANGSRGFSAEEKTAQEEAEAKVRGLDELIKAEERRIELEKANARNDGTGRIEVSAPNFEKDPRKGFTSSRDFLLAAISNSGLRDKAAVDDERLKMLAVVDRDDKQAGGELAFMLPVAFTPRHLATVGSDEQGGYADAYGGAAVPKTMLPGVLQLGAEADPLGGRTQMVPMATPVVELLARTDKNHTTSVSGGFTVARRAETVAAASSRSAMEMVTLKAASLFGLAYATEEILTDSPISFVSIIDSGFRSQFAAHMLNEKIRGLGGDQYLGILNSNNPALISVAKEAGQAADTVVTQNVLKMAARAWGFDNAIWIANHELKPHLFVLSITVGTGGVLLYQPSRGDGFPDMLLGRPIFYSEYASAIGDQGDLILVNGSQYLEGLYQPLQSAESVHTRFVNHERTFKFWLRNAGAPWWRSALTPNKGASTLSPFVTLDAR